MSAHNTPDGLAEVMGLLGKATPRDWYVGETLRAEAIAVIGDGDSVVCEFPDRIGGAEEDAAAIAAAVNYLRKHGEAIRASIEACRLLVAYDEGDQEDSVQLMLDYANAVGIARNAIQLYDTGRKPE